jgi:hypothetical protein
MFGMLWINMYDGVFQFPPISSNFSQLLKRSGTTFHRPQPTKMVVTPDTDWFSDPRHYFFLRHL